MQNGNGLRERKKERTRQAIIDAAWDLFRSKGYDATTVEEIADQADISRRTFFRYFPTKEAVVFHNSAERLARFRSLLLEGIAGDGGRRSNVGAVSLACLEVARHYVSARDQVVEQYKLIESSQALIMREGEIDREWMAAIAETLTEASEGSAAANRRARVLAGAVFGAMRATLAEWLAADGRLDLVALGNEAISLFSTEER